MLMFTLQRSTQIIHCRAWATCDLSRGWFLHYFMERKFTKGRVFKKIMNFGSSFNDFGNIFFFTIASNIYGNRYGKKDRLQEQ